MACRHGLSVDITNADCCLVCISPVNSDAKMTQDTIMQSFSYDHLPDKLKEEVEKCIKLLTFCEDNNGQR